MTPLTLYAAFAAAFVLLVWLGLLPPVRRGTRDANFAFRITMRDPSLPKYEAEPFAAVLAQELAEWLLKWLVAFVPGAVAVWAFGLAGLIASPLVLVIAHTWPRWPGGQRQLELIGHAVEIEAARRLGKGEDYATTEARRMMLGYPVFSGETAEQILAAMRRRRWIAMALLAVVWRRARRA